MCLDYIYNEVQYILRTGIDRFCENEFHKVYLMLGNLSVVN